MLVMLFLAVVVAVKFDGLAQEQENVVAFE
jgi:hypothetical protein